MTIHDYLYGVYEDFKQYVDNNHDLCQLRDMTFKDGHVPDYSDVHVQQYYLLRFVFSYAFEYKKMYERLLTRVGTFNGSVKVCSLGCGSMVDYWALTEILSDNKSSDTIVDYTGVNVVDWNYKFAPRDNDKIDFICGNAKDHFDSVEGLDHDIYIFPKSICEFAHADFCSVINSIADKNTKDRIYFLVSIRTEEHNMDCDMDRCKEIKSIMCADGYLTPDDANTHWSFIEKTRGIKAFDRKFDYPDEAKELLCDLTKKCGNRECVINMCESTFKRSPI
ncbi:MAG: hypothetical protein K2L54_00825, partial [Clostridiales bacterium]|nr:hypothetical protein [Clostridiales bacterium]